MSDRIREQSRAELVAALSPELRAEAMGSAEEQAALEFTWPFWARPSQLAPPGNWRQWLFLAGRGAGKTRTGAEWVRHNMCGDTPLTGGRWRHIGLIAETAADARDVMVGDGKAPSDPSAGSGILQVHPKDYLPLYEWPNGASASIFNATEYEQLRGPEFSACWCDELAKWAYQQQAWDMLSFCMRAGTDPRVFISTTPRPTALLKSIIADPFTHVTRGSTYDNIANLAPSYIAAIRAKYEGTRLGRQEIDAEILEDVEGALWSRPNIDANRIREIDLPPLDRIVIAIDPAVSTSENSDETGIICAGIGDNGEFYVLDDISGVYSPNEWARQAVSLYNARRADRIIAEANNGGDLVEQTIRSVAPNIAYRKVHASRGKVTRAEPISALYEQNRVHHVGAFPKLEDQVTSFCVDFDRKSMGYSPDRLDALVWALTELSEDAIAGSAKALFIGIETGGGWRQPSWYGARYG
jgi:phage terminase large subunit-like protein